ncbi:MAG: lipid A deacylase LpxR family protein [Lautropia sp.]|nr:lipid A deacylase LpxR family protein [Lautropia sp.]
MLRWACLLSVGVLGVLSLGVAVPAAAQQTADDAGGALACRRAAATQLRFKIDNDVATGRDHGYSSGLMLEAAARMPAHDGLSALPEEGWLCPVWRLLGGGRLPTETVSFRIDQNLYTPENSAARYLITNDRPYAAVLMAGLAATTLSNGQWIRNELRLGWVGPSVRGESSQNAVHKLIDAPRFRGWAHQLSDEPLFELAQYRVKRWQPGGAESDVLGHWGARLGTLQTSAYAGVEWRFGPDLQDDGGSAPLRPGANEPSEVLWHAPGDVRWTTFLTAGARLVAWDLTLDGNVGHDSHSVGRRPLVFDAGAGVTMRWESWALQLMWVLRSREFDEQRELPSYGSLQISYRF